MGGQFQSNSTDLFSTAAAVTRRYSSAAGFTRVYLCSTIRDNKSIYIAPWFQLTLFKGAVTSKKKKIIIKVMIYFIYNIKNIHINKYG